MRFPKIGSRKGPGMTSFDPQIDLQIDLQIDPQIDLQTGPQMSPDDHIQDLRYPYAQNRHYLTLLLIFVRQIVSRPRIGYARLLSPRNKEMVIGRGRFLLGYKPR